MSMQGGQGKERMGESMSGMHMSASQVTMYLKNTDFPADKRQIVDMAKSNGAPENIIQMLNKLPDKQYSNSTEIEREFTKMK